MGDLVLVERERSDGHRQRYWVNPSDVRETDRAVGKPVKDDAGLRHERLLEGSATSPAHPPPEPASGGLDEPPAIDFKAASAAATMAKAAKEKWGWKGQLHPAAAGTLVEACKALHEGLSQAPGRETLLGIGTSKVTTTSKLGPGVLGKYEPAGGKGEVHLAPQVAQRVQACMVKGSVETHEELQAFEVVVHEAGHGSSRMHSYSAKEKDGTRPHAAMEEATTEVVGQHYAAALVKGLGLKLNVQAAGPFGLKPHVGDAPLFKLGEDGVPKALAPIAYHGHVRALAAFAAVAEDAKADDEVGRALVNWAVTLKKTRGGLRFERLADRMLEGKLARDKDDDLYAGAVDYAISKQGALPVKNPPPFTAARQELADHMKWLMGQGKAVSTALLRKKVGEVVTKHKKGKGT